MIKRHVDYRLWCRYPLHDRAISNQIMQVIIKLIQIKVDDNLYIRNFGIILLANKYFTYFVNIYWNSYLSN